MGALQPTGGVLKRVVIDLRMAGYTGVGRYVRCLVQALARLQGARADFVVAGLANPAQDLGWLPGGVAIAKPEVAVGVYSAREQIVLGKILDRMGCDLVHLPHFVFPWRSPRTPVVTTIHDLIYLETSGAGKSRLHELAARRMLARAARRSARVITVSNFSKERLVARLGINPEKVAVIPHGAEHMALSPEDAPRDPATLLYVGNHLPHKNLPFLMRVFARVLAARPDARLVLAGPRGRHTEAAQQASRDAGVSGTDKISWETALEDEALVALYRRATILVFPSLYEGFGFPVLEAMRAGLPVAASAAASIPEVAGDAGLLLPPDDADAWTSAILALLSDTAHREDLSQRGRARAETFSWDKAARQTADVYQEVLATRLGAR